MRRNVREWAGVALLLGALMLALPALARAADSNGDEAASAVTTPTAAELAERWGIELVSLRTTAIGHMLDLRYRVLDAEKAAPLFGPRVEIALIDPKTGGKLRVPSPPKIGRMSQNRGKAIAGRVYAALFVNPGRMVQSGQRLGIAMGELAILGVPVL